MANWIVPFTPLLLFASPLAAQDSPDCATVTVSRATAADIPALEADAACFGRIETEAESEKAAAEKRRASARSSRLYRETKIAELRRAASILAAEVPLIPANFPTAPWYAQHGIPADNGRDPVGAFRLICQTSWVKQVDPLVEPGVKRSMHLHFGWGNDALDENSTYETLRTKGGSNCQGGPLYRSAGWAPALLDGDTVILPDFISTYYKRLPASSPACLTVAPKGCADFPAGLRFLVGRAYATGPSPGANLNFICVGAGGSKKTWGEAAAICSPGQRMEVMVIAPDCWDGVRIDAPDHQSHLAYQRRDPQTGRTHCPATHPYLIPQYTVSIFWAVGEGEKPADWTFSLNRVMGTPAGDGFHIDYWEAQEPEARVAWGRNCIDKHLNCSGGTLGDGRGFVSPPGFSFTAKVRRVAIP